MTVAEYLRFTDDMTSEEKLKRINRSRNYIRYNIIRGRNVDTKHPLLTEAERLYLTHMQDNMEAVKKARIALLTHFYDNCWEVGSTLKRKSVPHEVNKYI